MTDDEFFINNELRISCADAVELVTEYLEGALGPADLENFEAHLSLCEGCQVFVNQITKTVTLTSRTAETVVEPLPANFDALLEALDDGIAGD